MLWKWKSKHYKKWVKSAQKLHYVSVVVDFWTLTFFNVPWVKGIIDEFGVLARLWRPPVGLLTSRKFSCSSISIRSSSIKIALRAEKFRATFEPSKTRADFFRTQFDPSRSRTSSRADFEHQVKWFTLSKAHHKSKANRDLAPFFYIKDWKTLIALIIFVETCFWLRKLILGMC